ncbi:MAG: Gfo/Idh/MocA family oxidoreductase, partial [Planctomycetota bacterium]|nr:Gfo/Idh/MocA family oxidoreductase [Planctomycetota bacterium]
HEPMMARVVELVATNEVGPLRHISSGFSFAQSRSSDVRLDPALGGGSLWDIGCYAVGAARLIVGEEPTEAVGFATLADNGVDESFTGLLRFSRGIVATIHSSFRAAYRTWLEVAGADGVLGVASPFKPAAIETIELQRGDEVRQIIVEGSTQLFVRQIDDFVAAAIDGRPPTVSLADSRGNAAALAALHRSARSGRAVQL